MRRRLFLLLSIFFIVISIFANGNGSSNSDPVELIRVSTDLLNDSILRLNQDIAQKEKLIGDLQTTNVRQQGDIEKLKKEGKHSSLASIPKIAFYIFVVVVIALLICLFLEYKKKKRLHFTELDKDEIGSGSQQNGQRRGIRCKIVDAPKDNITKTNSNNSYQQHADDYERRKKSESQRTTANNVTDTGSVTSSASIEVKSVPQSSPIVKYCSTLTPGIGGAMTVPDRAMKPDFSEAALFRIEIKGGFAEISICEENMNRLLEQYPSQRDAFDLEEEKPNYTKIKMLSSGRLSKEGGSWLMVNKIRIKCE